MIAVSDDLDVWILLSSILQLLGGSIPLLLSEKGRNYSILHLLHGRCLVGRGEEQCLQKPVITSLSEDLCPDDILLQGFPDGPDILVGKGCETYHGIGDVDSHHVIGLVGEFHSKHTILCNIRDDAYLSCCVLKHIGILGISNVLLELIKGLNRFMGLHHIIFLGYFSISG